MVSFIISYTPVILSLWGSDQKVSYFPLPRLVSSAFNLSSGFSSTLPTSPPLFLFLFRPQCISNEKCSSQLAHPSILCVPGFPGIFTLVSFKRLIVNSRVRRIASDETYGCLKASFEEIKIEYHTYAGIGTTNGKEAKTRNEKARESNARATIFQIVRHSLRITRGKNFPRNYIFLLHYRLSIIEMHTRCFARLIHWSVELCVVAVEPRAAECRKLARKLPS